MRNLMESRLFRILFFTFFLFTSCALIGNGNEKPTRLDFEVATNSVNENVTHVRARIFNENQNILQTKQVGENTTEFSVPVPVSGNSYTVAVVTYDSNNDEIYSLAQSSQFTVEPGEVVEINPTLQTVSVSSWSLQEENNFLFSAEPTSLSGIDVENFFEAKTNNNGEFIDLPLGTVRYDANSFTDLSNAAHEDSIGPEDQNTNLEANLSSIGTNSEFSNTGEVYIKTQYPLKNLWNDGGESSLILILPHNTTWNTTLEGVVNIIIGSYETSCINKIDNATVHYPKSAETSIPSGTIQPQDTIAAITPSGECAGYGTWIDGQGVTLAAAGTDDIDFTEDGFNDGETIKLLVDDVSEGATHIFTPNVKQCDETSIPVCKEGLYEDGSFHQIASVM